VRVTGLPGTSCDWITLVKSDTPDNEYGTNACGNGSKAFTWSLSSPWEPGSYEARIYFDYYGNREERYIVRARKPFTVMPQ
jgi:hypothetical protein